MPENVTLYALSTCGWCKKTKRFLESHQIEYICHDVDTLDGEEKDRVREAVAKANPRKSYPTLVVEVNSAVMP